MVSRPAPGVVYWKVACLVGSAPTNSSRNFGAASARVSVAPWPSIVMSLAIGGRPFGPYQWLSTAVSVYVQPAPRAMTSGAPVALAAVIAAIRELTSPVVPVQFAASGAAPAAWGRRAARMVAAGMTTAVAQRFIV